MPTIKMSFLQAQQLRALYKAGRTQVQLADIFGIAQPTVSQILANRLWTDPSVSGADIDRRMTVPTLRRPWGGHQRAGKLDYSNRRRCSYAIAQQIRADSALGLSPTQLVQKYGQGRNAINRILRGVGWNKELPREVLPRFEAGFDKAEFERALTIFHFSPQEAL